jgi:hypothetical protein
MIMTYRHGCLCDIDPEADLGDDKLHSHAMLVVPLESC